MLYLDPTTGTTQRSSGEISLERRAGLGNALVYGWTPRVRRLYATRYPQWCSCLNEKEVPREHTPPSLVQVPQPGSGTGREIEAVESTPDI